jgi:hypothetical protein
MQHNATSRLKHSTLIQNVFLEMVREIENNDRLYKNKKLLEKKVSKN